MTMSCRNRPHLLLLLIAIMPVACKPAEPAPKTAADAPAKSSAPSASAPSGPPADDTGAALYAEHCAACHGASGLGDGALASMLSPPPRGLVDEPWRYLDTTSLETTRASMADLIRKGMPDKAMPGLAGKASDEEILQVVDFVLSLRAD
jgi:high-affinity iron transporter